MMDRGKLKEVLVSIFHEYTQEMVGGAMTGAPWSGKAIREERFSEMADEIMITLDVSKQIEKRLRKTRILAAFCGTGKTYVCERTDVSAVEVEYWKYKDGRRREYVEEVKKHLGEVDYIFVATDPEGLKLLREEGLAITLVYPKKELRSEYLDRFIARDSGPDFIGAFMKFWNPWIEELKEQTHCKHVILGEGQYLRDIL